MACSYPLFNSRHRSRAQKQNIAHAQTLATAARRSGTQSNKENIPHHPDITSKTPEDHKDARIKDLERRLHNMTQRFHRAEKTIKALRAQNRKLLHTLKKIMEELKQSNSSEPDVPRQSLREDTEKIKKLLMSNAQFHKQVDALRKQVQRKNASVPKKINMAVENAKVTTAMVYYIKCKGTITSETWRLICMLVELGVPFGSILYVIRRVFLAANIPVLGSFTNRSVHRVILKGGVAANIQIAHEIKQTESLTISGDGTSLKNVHFESAFLMYKVPPPTGDLDPSDPTNEPQLCTMPILMVPNHTSQEQLNGWELRFVDMTDMYNRLPFSMENPLTLAEILEKIKGMLSDHANDQKHLADLFEK
ncbi:hypothetical protein EWM64_g2732 [Hericium alpestre]|uniref:Uncharacterized protein n=1 Tax=Hericium alpestre TaxID=135208 RepID=A0A4Z0A4C2_9AGAM|nr:hypothetical protein EWM64_g2732 [Hericium alpestre]